VRTTLGIAQAAVLLLAAWLGSRSEMPQPPHPIRPRTAAPLARKPVPNQPAPAPAEIGAEVDIPDGVLLVIRSDGSGVRFTQLADDGSDAVDPSFYFLGKLEAMAE
jgi:hypothetical protein